MHELSRRKAVAIIGASIATPGILSSVCALAETPPTSRRLTDNARAYRFRIGDIEATTLLTGFMDIAPAQPFIAPEARPDEFRSAVASACIQGHARLPFNVLLLRRGSETTLIDSGPGSTSTSDDLATALEQAGCRPDEITTVILTHAHFDHLGGMLDRSGSPAFKRARHFCLSQEYTFWVGDSPDLSQMRMHAEAKQSMINQARHVFSKVAFQRIEAGATLPCGITVFHSPGHTPGHMTLRVQSGSESLYHIADLTHHAGLLIPRPEWTVGSDTDPARSALTRQKLFSQLAESNERVFGCHLPFPGSGYLRRDGIGFRWLAEDWSV